jgi:hypothetical protein
MFANLLALCNGRCGRGGPEWDTAVIPDLIEQVAMSPRHGCAVWGTAHLLNGSMNTERFQFAESVFMDAESSSA